MFSVALFTRAKLRKQPKCPLICKQINKMVYCMCACIYIYTHILLFSHVVEILPLSTTWMNLEGILLSEVSQTEKDERCMISLICGI